MDMTKELWGQIPSELLSGSFGVILTEKPKRKTTVHKYQVVKKTFCGLDLIRRKHTVSSFWEQVNCKKCLQKRENIRASNHSTLGL